MKVNSENRTLRSWPPILSVGRHPRAILLTRECFGRWSWRLRPRILRPGAQRSPVLFAGPWVGEFGWELMNWQGLLRSLRSDYQRIIVCSYASSKALYQDFSDGFFSHQVRGQPNAHVAFDIINPDELRRALVLAPPGSDHLTPLRFVPESAQQFIRFGSTDSRSGSAEILVHARGGAWTPYRNWSLDKWTALVRNLHGKGLRVGAIGLTRSTLSLSGVEDYRDAPLRETMDRLACARLALGPSSGPMHLASLCGTPHLVWTDRRSYGMGKSSREKYERWWNPLSSPVRVLDEYGFDPPVEVVLSVIGEMLQYDKHQLQ